jgi:hypothetical protein
MCMLFLTCKFYFSATLTELSTYPFRLFYELVDDVSYICAGWFDQGTLAEGKAQYR